MTRPPASLRIALIDDHILILDGLEKTLRSIAGTPEVIAAYSPIEILKRILGGEHFDLIICDLIMDGMNGLAFLGALKSQQNQIPVLIMSGIALDPPIGQMKALGAAGFIHKSTDPASLERVVNKILSGQTYFPDQDTTASSAITEPVDQDGFDAMNNLTDRQLVVLKALASGASNREISDRLSISQNTVKTHIKNIYDAMGVSRRTACIQKARLYGII